MSVHLLRACCCGGVPECPLYPPQDCGGWGAVDGAIRTERFRLDSWWESGLGGAGGAVPCRYEGSALAVGPIEEIGQCQRTSGPSTAVFGISTGFVQSSTANCVDDARTHYWGLAKLDIDENGNIEFGRVAAHTGFANFAANALAVNWPATTATRTFPNRIDTLDVSWVFADGVMRIVATFTVEVDNGSGELEKSVSQYEMTAWAFVSPEGGQVCNPQFPAFTPADPPDWYSEPPEPLPCPQGCVLGPIGFAAAIAGVGGSGALFPTQSEWEAVGGTWGCSQGVTYLCSAGFTILAIVGCGASVNPESLEALCANIVSPGSVPFPQSNSGGCANCGSGGVL